MEKENSFVKIKTVFSDNKDRTIESLKNLYEAHEFLVKELNEISADVLTIDFVRSKKVLLKPNWVKHFYRPDDDICLCTHHNFLLAFLEVILAKQPGAVVIGDAPIQGCKWEKLVTQEFVDKVNKLAGKFNSRVEIKDFRRVVFDTEKNNLDIERNSMSEYVIFDVGKRSYLEPITDKRKNLFRVSQYNADKFINTHRPGVHKYCITNELFDADIIISLPKVKTHQKAGITCALKNIVGLNGDKDFLPHHRIGGTGMGGDSYPGNNLLRYWSELATDNANRKKGKKIYWFWLRLASLLWKISLPKKNHQLSAAWFGNDTTWRMVMDLNLIVNYGRADGTLADTPQRYLYSLCDGIIGGQGDGPLKPEPLSLGVICFTNNSSWTDIYLAMLMGIDVKKTPLLKAAKSFSKDLTEFTLNQKLVAEEDLKDYVIQAQLPPGWVNY